MQKEKIDTLLNQLKTNTMIYEQLPMEIFEENESLLFSRLKTQKNIFIKEVCLALKIEQEKHFDDNSDLIKKEYDSFIEMYGSALADETSEKCIAVILKVENRLHKNYSDLLLDSDLSEIAKMILSNQSNEIKRDISGFKYIREDN